ncbi:MAG TPA: aspartyl protease family protein [Methylomirabilota bacterium]|nr:aspartyl protease family protein [Methylomirabilota bacterium]
MTLAVAVLLTAAPAAAQLYRWTDAAGTVHYTTDLATVPAAYRDGARDIGAPTPGPRPAPPAAGGVAIPYTGGPLVVDASLNGVPLRLIVDTGADRTLISPTAMARAGFDPGAGTPVQIRGVTGDAAATLVGVPRLDVAGAQVGPIGVIVHPVAAEGADGLLGRDVLDAFTVTVDTGARRALLVPR